ncbi:MAG: aminopeptidase P family protein [Clostridiales bacterium]|nr:aminopeptidase P family protein [Clostridiales bacterium]
MFKERIRFPIPTRELERRWRLVKAEMQKQGIDLLIMQNSNMFLGGYVRYFTDIPAEHAYPVSVLFPAEGDMITITSSSPDNPLYPEWAVRGVELRLGIPYFRSLDFTKHYDAEAIAKIIKDRKYKTVGFVNLGLINAALYGYLTENLKEVKFIEATELVDRIKAVKSEDELVYVRKAVKMHDNICAALASIIRPGIYEYEIRNEIKYLLSNMGSEEQLIKIGSAPAGEPTPFLDTFFLNRRLSEGDSIQILIECSGPGGFYSEIQRASSLGEPHKDMIEAWETSKKVQQYAASLLKPGANFADLMKKVNAYLVDLGQPEEKRLLGHGQGYDLVERPGISADETMEVQPNMYFGIHSEIKIGKGAGAYTDNYIITEDGTVRMHKTPQEIFAL